jgi:hypothetical protein
VGALTALASGTVQGGICRFFKAAGLNTMHPKLFNEILSNYWTGCQDMGGRGLC